MAAELGSQTVELSALVRRVAEEAFLYLKELVERFGNAVEERSDVEKKIELLKFIDRTRQRMLRLLVVAKWCQQVPLVQYCQQLAATLSSHDTCFTQTADTLFYMHEGLEQARAPMFDVASAIEVLRTGSYPRLPKCIEDLASQSSLDEDEQRYALKKLDGFVRSKLLEISLPKEISEVKVSRGIVELRVRGEFKVLLTLGYRGHLLLWRILHLELLLGEKNGLVKLEESRRYALGDDLERRMAAVDNPFITMYSVLHEFCVALIMDTVIRQVQVLRQGRWKDAVRFELISDGTSGQTTNTGTSQPAQEGEVDSSVLKTPGLKFIYWLDSEKNTEAISESSSSPFIKIEPVQDFQIKCVHSSFLLDPYTDTEAEFSLDQSCIDVEKLLLHAISCNKHTRLLEIQRELVKTMQVFGSSDDVILRRERDEGLEKEAVKSDEGDFYGDEVLCVRAYGGSHIYLRINIRNGRFLLHSSNVLPESTLRDCEDAINQGSMTAAEVFMTLRGKSILNLFASTSRLLGLKVYSQSMTTIKIPKSILDGSDLLLMEFPQCGNSYYLLMQLDKVFKPVFKLLEAQSHPDSSSRISNDLNHVTRFIKIDINRMKVVKDEMNFSLLGLDELMSLPVSNETADCILSEFGLKAVLQLQGSSKSSFSSLVDEIFEFDKGANGPNGSHHASSLNVGSQFSSYPIINQQTTKSGNSSTTWEGRSQQSQLTNSAKLPSATSSLSTALPVSSNARALINNSPSNSFLVTSPVRSMHTTKLLTSKADQDPSTLKSSLQTKGVKSSITSQLVASMGNFGPFNGAEISISACQSRQSFPTALGQDTNANRERTSRKRTLKDILPRLFSSEEPEVGADKRKRRKIKDTAGSCTPTLQGLSSLPIKPDGYTYGDIISDAKHGLTTSKIYDLILHVVRHCSLIIKHARLTSQLDALDIPYVEEPGVRTPSSNLWLRLPFVVDESWKKVCLRLGKLGTMCWDVKINDKHFRDLWELQKGSATTPWGCGVRIANTSDVDSHISYDTDGLVLSYISVEAGSIKKLMSDLRRLSNARLFAREMWKLLGSRADDKFEDVNTESDGKSQQNSMRGSGEIVPETIRKTFKIEAVGLMSLWFSYGIIPVTVHFVVEWESGYEGCTIHVSPDQLWPHTKFLEDFVDGAEVPSFLDCIRLTAGPLLALNHAIRPARMPGPVTPTSVKPNSLVPIQQGNSLPHASPSIAHQQVPSVAGGTIITPFSANQQNIHAATTMLSASGRGGPGIVPSSLLPIDVSVVLRGPYWIRIIYRKKFSVDMRCFAGDQVWLQPATPPKGGPTAGGSLPCPQFRPFIMEHVAQGLNALEPTSFSGTTQASGGGTLAATTNAAGQNSSAQAVPQNGNRLNVGSSGVLVRQTSGSGGYQQTGSLNRVGNIMLASSGITAGLSGVPSRIAPGIGVPVHVRGELNTAFIGLGDDGGYGGGWVPLAALKKVLRGILKYLGVLWLFAQLPELLKEILGSILKENEGALLNLDQEQPALRFFVGGYVFAVSVHRVQLLLQVLSVKRFHHQQQQQSQSNIQEELTQSEISEICEYFSRRVASEPYDASRVASFITLLTLPISILREFLKLIAWKKGLVVDSATPAQKARIELCLENHSRPSFNEETAMASVAAKSNIHHDRTHNAVEFSLTFVIDQTHIPHVNSAGGAAWLPYCVSVRLKYSFGDQGTISLVWMEGSHGGRACWVQAEDWDKCKQRLARSIDYANGSSGDVSQGRVKLVAESLQRALQVSLQQLRDGGGVHTLSSTSTATATMAAA